MSRRVVAVFLLLLVVLVALARVAPPAKSDVPVAATAVPQSEFVPVRSGGRSETSGQTSRPSAAPPVSNPGAKEPSVSPTNLQSGERQTARTPNPSPAAGNRPAPSLPLRAAVRTPVLPKASAASVTGIASWYAYVPGGAAAGPALRTALGAGWRGTSVAVCRTDGGAMACVRVVLSDWCACGDRNGVPTVIDLDAASFAALMPLSRGLVSVEVVP